VLFDANFWKSFISGRMRLPAGDPQGLTVHAGYHELLADHLGSNVPVRVSSRIRTVDEWKLIPGREDHWLDCIVGSAVAASFTGISAVGAEDHRPLPRKRKSPEELAVRRAEMMRMAGM